MASGCVKQDCTVADTGTCLLSNDPSSCPHRLAAEDADAQAISAIDLPAKATFPSSRACTLSDAREVMGERYVHLVGILGEPNAGKTGCLVSLYLSVAQTRLDGFAFADSRTLMGFEEISQGARRWNDGRIPEQFTDHTVLPDNRTAGFLHLRLARMQQGNSVDLLCSDLPGEWTTEFIDQNRIDRLQFLNRADVVWLVVDGTETVAPDKRQVCLQRTTMAIGRLGDFLASGRRLILVVTRRDEMAPDDGVVQEICAEGRRCGFETESVVIASFSKDDGEVPAGTGIARLVELTTAFDRDPAVVWQRDAGGASFESPRIGLVRRGNA